MEKLYRIICANHEKTAAFAELITEPLRLIDDEIYYTDARGRSWCCTYDFINGRIITDPDIIRSGPGNLYHIRTNTGTPARLYVGSRVELKRFKENVKKNHPAFFGGEKA